MAPTALAVAERVAAEGIAATVIDPRWVKPVPRAVVELARHHRIVVTLEDNLRVGGVGSAVSQALRDADIDLPCREVGIPLQFLPHATPAEVKTSIGLTEQDIARRVLAWVSHLPTDPALSPPHTTTDQDHTIY